MSRSDIACFPHDFSADIVYRIACAPEYHAPNCVWCGHRVGPYLNQARRATIKRRLFIIEAGKLFSAAGYDGPRPATLKACAVVLNSFSEVPAVSIAYLKLWKDR